MKTPDNIEAVLMNLPGQAKPMQIFGDPEVLADYAAELQAYDQEHVVAAPRTRRVGTAVIEAVEQPVRSLVGNLATRISTDVTAALYDRRNGTRFLDALREKRQLDKDLKMAGRLGLLQEEVCARHRKALEQVKVVRAA